MYGSNMKLKVQIAFALLLAVVLSLDSDGDSEKSRKHYGLSFHANCRDYIKTFTCLSACKSIGFQIFRLDFTCKCSCHELKTTTLLPFFKWRTNGTTKSWANTFRPQLYNIIGTLSPATYVDYTDNIDNETTVTDVETTTGDATDGGDGENDLEALAGEDAGGEEEATEGEDKPEDDSETTAPPEE